MDQRTQHEMISILPRLRRFAVGLTRDSAQADDLVQIACEKAIRQIHQWQYGTRLDSWMFRIIQTTHIDQLRAQKHRNSHLVNDQNQMPQYFDGENFIMARLSLENVSKALENLTEDHRAVIMLVFVEGYPYKEAAEILNIPIGTLTSRLMRARNTLLQKASANDSGLKPLPANTCG